jgi:hypothetical protein
MSGTRSPARRRWFSAFLPSARQPDGATARFLDRGALSQPAVALDLVAKQQLAVAQALPQYLDDIREDTRAGATVSAGAHHATTVAVLKQVAQFMAELPGSTESSAMMQEAARLAERNELLAMLGDSIRELADSMRDSTKSGALATLSASLAEGLHLVLVSAIDAIESPDPHNLEMLHHLTADRSQMMEAIRKSLMRGEQTLTIEEHQALFTSTRLFERIIKLLRQLQLGLAPRVT